MLYRVPQMMMSMQPPPALATGDVLACTTYQCARSQGLGDGVSGLGAYGSVGPLGCGLPGGAALPSALALADDVRLGLAVSLDAGADARLAEVEMAIGHPGVLVEFDQREAEPAGFACLHAADSNTHSVGGF